MPLQDQVSPTLASLNTSAVLLEHANHVVGSVRDYAGMLKTYPDAKAIQIRLEYCARELFTLIEALKEKDAE